jgi:N-acetylmuramoyl-L-alanine amidase
LRKAPAARLLLILIAVISSLACGLGDGGREGRGIPLPILATPEPTPSDPPWIVRVPRPSVPPGPRRVGVQAGHWKTDEVPDELVKLRELSGGTFDDLTEWEYALDIANRVAAMLQAKGYVVDVLPATLPEQYLADAFVSLHADGDVTGGARGYKIAHGVRRGPYEDALTTILSEEYARATRLPLDFNITDDMWDYYAFRWDYFRASVAPHTPAAIIELGFLTNTADRAVLLRQPDLVAGGVANGIHRFLSEVPSRALFRDELVVPRRTPSP